MLCLLKSKDNLLICEFSSKLGIMQAKKQCLPGIFKGKHSGLAGSIPDNQALGMFVVAC
jgi:hypothetical protein